MIKVGERYIPYNLNIIMVTFFRQTLSDGCVPNNFSTAAIYSSLTQSERLKYKNNSSKVFIKKKEKFLHTNTPALLYKVLFTAVWTNAVSTWSRCTLQM